MDHEPGTTDRELTRTAKVELADLVGALPVDQLGAFALFTDDDVMTLLAASASREWMRDERNSMFRFWPPDWPNPELGPLHRTNACLRRRTEQAVDMVEHVHRSFECLVTVLEALRLEGVLPSDTELFLMSNDPSHTTERLATEAVRRLNGDDVFQAWIDVWGDTSSDSR